MVSFCIYLIFLLSIVSYEVHVHAFFYTQIQLIIFVLVFLTIMLMLKNKELRVKLHELKRVKAIQILMSLMIFSSLISALVFSFNSILSIFTVVAYCVNIFFYFCILPVYFKIRPDFMQKLFKFIILTMLPIIVFGILLYYSKGILGYRLEGGRSGSILFDPNFFSIMVAISSALLLKVNFRMMLKLGILVLSIVAIILSGSRGTVLSCFVALFYFVSIKFPGRSLRKKIASLILVGIVFFGSFLFLDSRGFFRVDQGSHGRSEQIGYSLIRLSESPVYGFGYDSVPIIMSDGGFRVTTSHNSFVDVALRYGYIVAIIELFIIMKAIFLSFKRDRESYVGILLAILFINMNTILYSLGGLGLPSIMLTLMTGESYRSDQNE